MGLGIKRRLAPHHCPCPGRSRDGLIGGGVVVDVHNGCGQLAAETRHHLGNGGLLVAAGDQDRQAPAATCGLDTDVKFKSNLVRLGLNYRF